MHLLLTYDFPPIPGGISRWMGELARRYPAHELVVSTGQHPDSQDTDPQFGVTVDRVPISARRLRTIQGLLLWSRRAATLARLHRPSFTWCGNLKPAAYPAKWVRERVGVPYGAIVHGTDLLLLQHRIHQSVVKRRAAQALLQSASVLVANSRWTRNLCLTVLNELGLKANDTQVRTVPLGTDPGHFRPGVDTDAVRARYRLPRGRYLVTVARLAAHKGIDTVLRVVATLAREVPELRYAVVGSGQKQEELETLARELGVADRVHFLTDVPDRDLPALYNLAEVYLGVSRPAELMIEGFGIALTEASACGVPVVAGTSGGMPDAVRDGETGLLVDSESVEAVTGAVRRLLEDRELARRLGAEGRRAVETFYNWDRVTAELRDIAEEFSRRPAPRRAAR
ncbi:MAG TPA: glycosyltransferase family 4 protein [Gemmatimonadales bacterium]|nr:glycosyltransferase family 4 protein [Gemmatimonadales bacterium]